MPFEYGGADGQQTTDCRRMPGYTLYNKLTYEASAQES